MKRFESIICLMLWMNLWCLAGMCLAKDPSSAVGSERYNVVLIVGDAVRPDFLSCYGGETKTPHLDWLRENGVLFERAYSAAPWTSPSAVSIITGNDAVSYKTEPLRETVKVLVPDNELLLLEVLQKRGYENRYNIENWNARIHNHLQGAEALSPDLRQAPLALSLEEIEKQTGIYQEGLYGMSYSFLDFLLSVDANQPFFAVKWFMDPHAPYKPNRKFRDRVMLDGKHLADSDQYVDLSSKRVLAQKDEPQASTNKALYKASIESVDERVGFILTALEKRDLLAKTFIIFISDHGELFGEHGMREHGGFGKNCTYYEPLVRVPLIMSGPLLPKGKMVSEAVSLIDLMPTIKQLLALDYPDDMQGKSLLGLVNGDASLDKGLYFSNIIENKQEDALLKGDYKLITFRDGPPVLYNLRNDPGEEKDLFQSEPVMAQSMMGVIAERRSDNSKRRTARAANVRGYIPKSKQEEKEIIKQLKSLGYIK